MTAAAAAATFKSADCATATPIGINAACVPVDVPNDVATKALITKIPGMSKLGGMTESPIFTIASCPPIAEAALANPPANNKINPSSAIPEEPAFSVKILIFFATGVFRS